MRRTSILSAGVLTLCMASGCKGKTKTEPVAAQSASAKPAPTENLQVDALLMQRLTAVSKNCVVANRTGIVGQCEGREAVQLSEDMRTGKVDRLKALSTMAEAANSDDAKLRTVAVSTLYTSFRNGFDKAEPGSVAKPTAKRFLELLPKLEELQASQVAPVAVHTAFLSGQPDALWAALDKASPRVRGEAYRHLMTHGKMSVFGKIQEIVKGDNVADAVNALESVRRSVPTADQDKATVCDWAQTLLADDRTQVTGKVGTVLVECKGKYVDALIDSAQKRLDDKTFDAPFARSFSYACTRRGILNGDEGAEQQCEKIRTVLEKVLASGDIPDSAKVPVVMDLARQWPDARAKKAIAKHAKSKDRQLQLRSSEAMRLVDDLQKRAERMEKMEAERKRQQAKDAKAGAAKKPAPAPSAGKPPAQP